MRKIVTAALAATLLLLFSANSLFAQPNADTQTVLREDSIFWTAYNSCNIESLMKFVTSDVEFYHDKNGMLKGEDRFRDAFKNGLCGDKQSRTRREAVKETINVYLLKDRDTTYGAIIAGDHLFYLTQGNKPEKLVGTAKFANLWILKDNTWKMSRILSFSHEAAN